MDETSFVEFLFRRPAETEWYFGSDFEEPAVEAADVLRLANWLFRNIERIVDPYSEKQICMGLNYLISNSCGSWCYSFLDQTVLVADRVSAITSMYNVFENLFAKRCHDILAHDSSATYVDAMTYNQICYMWWDIFPRHGVPPSQNLKEVDEAIIGTIERILQIANLACKESALHGLGHWYPAQPELVGEIIQRNAGHIPDQLAGYALKASTGAIQ